MRTITVKKNLLYQESPPLALDAYLPAEMEREKPLVLLIHGGGFENGDKEQPFYVKLSEEIARKTDIRRSA